MYTVLEGFLTRRQLAIAVLETWAWRESVDAVPRLGLGHAIHLEVTGADCL